MAEQIGARSLAFARGAQFGFYLWLFGVVLVGTSYLNNGGPGGGNADMVWWTSSNAREFGGGLWDWLPPATVASLVTRKIVMPPAQTSCQIPAEVKKASGEMMFGNLNAFGPEANFSYPPKPAGNAVWNIDWTAKVRFRSHTMLLVGAVLVSLLAIIADLLLQTLQRALTPEGLRS